MLRWNGNKNVNLFSFIAAKQVEKRRCEFHQTSLFILFLYNVFAILPFDYILEFRWICLLIKRCHVSRARSKSFWGLTSCTTSLKLASLNKRSRHHYLLISPFKKHSRIHTSKFHTTNQDFTPLVNSLVLQFNIFYINHHNFKYCRVALQY